MKKILLAIALVLLPVNLQAAGPFDGIYSVNFNGALVGYASIHEDETTNNMIAVIFDAEPLGSDWNAISGTRIGNNASLNSIAGTISLNINATFNDSNGAVATIVSCSGDCDFPNGTVLNLNRIF